MRSRALLTVRADRTGRSVITELRSQAPLTLLPRRPVVRDPRGAVVHLVSSAATPLGGDEAELVVRVGPGARLRLSGTAASVALPGPHTGGSSARVLAEVESGGTLEYLPEPTVVTARAEHLAELDLRLGREARVRCRETVVLGRFGEPPGHLRTTVNVLRERVPLLRQSVDFGSARLRASPGYLAGARVLATEILVWDHDPRPAAGTWWSLTPLAAGGALVTAAGADAVCTARRMREALARHPDAAALEVPG